MLTLSCFLIPQASNDLEVDKTDEYTSLHVSVFQFPELSLIDNAGCLEYFSTFWIRYLECSLLDSLGFG